MSAGSPTGGYTPPAGVEDAVRILADAGVPPPIVDVARRLQEQGHAAVVVGGAVRDALLGLPASDWDLATSATPTEVQALFRRTIPTGIDHGTVTVLVRAPGGGPPVGVEVTTFRGEEGYEDGRRPTRVTFHRDLHDDLARRDFTVNAFAWDPVRQVFTDPFAGLDDLRRGIIRAVGDPHDRFGEDGLRTMRAVRLCATRGFDLDPATRDAIAPALDVLDMVSRERVHAELFKLLAAEQPSRGLVPMAVTGMWDHVLAPLSEPDRRQAIADCDAIDPEPATRLARLLWPLVREGAAGRERIAACIDHLRPSRAERATVLALTSEAVEDLAAAADPAAIRRAASTLGRAHLEGALAVLGASPDRAQEVRAACTGVPLTTGELAIKGGELIAAGLVTRGPAVGELLRALLDRVLEDPSLGTRERLEALARELAAS